MGGTLRISNFKFQISEYKVHQVDTKDSGSQNFSFLSFKATSVASRQISICGIFVTSKKIRHKTVSNQ
jgi:hypothetical protein